MIIGEQNYIINDAKLLAYRIVRIYYKKKFVNQMILLSEEIFVRSALIFARLAVNSCFTVFTREVMVH